MVNDDTEFELLRNLDDRNLNRSHRILLVSKSLIMRGTDFRSVKKGILLIVARAFDSQRETDQGLARVGRFGDKCKRLLLDGIELVDKERSL